MSAVIGAIWSLVAAAGAALAVIAPFGAAGHGGQYLAGHVLLGVGLGQLLAAVLRVAARRVLRKAPQATQVSLAALPEPAVAAARPVPEAIPATAIESTAVTVLRPRPAAVMPLRGRHAA
ncbi:hypothetical protein FHJ30_09605 [Arthrobacter sp. BB-1]|uniref:hypothetical protein n=1 Tax=unclassified Arthrobacter TaxID=235627 RepID=UPI001112B8D7|nr:MULTISPECIES: hypothetical protein [unclassified Arthrobacter]TNB72551.1 hypothetical protein FHJ30_09605 [Arthrobacter sp. BB-1]